MKKILFIVAILTLLTGCGKTEPTTLEKKENYETNLIDEEKDTELNEDSLTIYLENVTNELTNLIEKENISNGDIEVVKNTFTTLTDFLLNDISIKGKNFDSLKEESKEKIMTIYENVYEKIKANSKVYKELIMDISKETYASVKTKILELKQKYLKETNKSNIEQRKNIEDVSLNLEGTIKPIIDVVATTSQSIYESTKQNFNAWTSTLKEEEK